MTDNFASLVEELELRNLTSNTPVCVELIKSIGDGEIAWIVDVILSFQLGNNRLTLVHI